MNRTSTESQLIEQIGSEAEAEQAVLNEIHEVNLSYLLMAQRLARHCASTAMFRLGLSREMIDLITSLTLAQMISLAASSQVLCRFRFDDRAMLTALTERHRDPALRQAHAAILMAAQPPERFT